MNFVIGIDAHNLEGDRTGVGRYLYNLLRAWSIADYRLPTTARFILYFKNEIPGDLPESDLFEPKLLSVSSTAKFVHWDLPRAASKDKIDILFCPGYVAPIIYRGKIVLALHDIIYEAHPKWFSWKSPADKVLLKWVSKKSAEKASVILVPSEFTRQEVLKYYKVAPEKAKLIYLAADESRAKFSEGDIQKIKEKYRIKKNFIFYAGSIFSRRHLAEIIEAFGRLAAQRPDLQLFLVGKDYTEEKNIADLLVCQNDALGREVVIRVDFVSDSELKLLYSACAFFIWLSDYEGFGLPPLEAMAFGVPVLTSGNASLKEVVGQAALLVKNTSDVREIYEMMKGLVEDENLRQDLIRRGREQAAGFSWEKCAELTSKSIIDVIASGAKQSRG